MKRLVQLWVGVLATVLLLSGCALPRVIDSDVESYPGSAPAVAGASYRFDRLPSQQAYAARQAQIEALAQTALGHAGLVRNDQQARYSVQVDVQVSPMQSPYPARPIHRRPIVTADGSVFFPPSLPVVEPAWFSHSVHFLMRETSTAQVAYETTARFDGPWSDSSNLLPVVMDAALSNYPNPPPGLRKVIIELPAAGSGAR
jgi:hypothetical protein